MDRERLIEDYRNGIAGADPLVEELGERLLAIEAVTHAHPDVRIVEHLLIALVDFLDGSGISRAIAVEGLMSYVAAWPPRSGAVETLEFVAHVLRWPTLRDSLEALSRNDDADFRNRDLASSALLAFNDDWPQGGVYRALRQ